MKSSQYSRSLMFRQVFVNLFCLNIWDESRNLLFLALPIGPIAEVLVSLLMCKLSTSCIMLNVWFIFQMFKQGKSKLARAVSRRLPEYFMAHRAGLSGLRLYLPMWRYREHPWANRKYLSIILDRGRFQIRPPNDSALHLELNLRLTIDFVPYLPLQRRVCVSSFNAVVQSPSLNNFHRDEIFQR